MGFGVGGYGGYGYGPGFYGGYGAAGYGAAGYGGYGASGGLRWFFALLILIIIVLQFGRKQFPCNNAAAFSGESTECSEFGVTTSACRNFDSIDNSVLFIIVVFLLVLCGGCWGGGGGFGSY